MASATADDKLRGAAIAGVITAVVLELAFWAIGVPESFAGYGHASALVSGLIVFVGVLMN